MLFSRMQKQVVRLINQLLYFPQFLGQQDKNRKEVAFEKWRQKTKLVEGFYNDFVNSCQGLLAKLLEWLSKCWRGLRNLALSSAKGSI